MSDYKLPELPSDDELGITEEDLRGLDEAEQAPAAAGRSAPPTPPGPGRGGGGEDDPAGARRWRGPLMLLATIILAWVASIRTGMPPVIPADAPDTTFSAARAMAVVTEIARAPRPTGSPEHGRVREDLVERLRSLGLATEVQTATAIYEGPGFARAATVRNVLARLPGTDPTGSVVLTAHYDGTELSPATGDNASGLATILEAVRALQAGAPPRNDVIVLFTDAEEIGLLGAEAFVRDHAWIDDVQIVLSFEMRGSGGPSILFETADENGFVLRALVAANPGAFGTSMGEEFFRYMPNATDFAVFERAGKQGLSFAAIDNAAVYHTPRDLPSELSDRTVQHHGLHALGALRAFADADLTGTRGPDVVYFTVPVLGLVVYSAGWVLPLSGLLLLTALGVYLVARRGGARTSRVVIGLGVGLIAISLGFGAGSVLVDQAYGAHVEAGRLPGALFYGEGWYVVAIAAAAFFIVALLVAAARRHLSLVELSLGAALLPVAAAVFLGFSSPLAAMQLQWPALSALLSTGALALLGPRADTLAGWAVALLFAVPVLFLLVPAVELLWLAATLRQAGSMGALMVVGLLLVLPAVDTMRAPNPWWAPVLALVVGVGFVGMARLGNDVSPLSPVPTTLAYAYERGTDAGLWITDPRTAAFDPESDVGRWLAARTGSPFDRTLELGGIGYRIGSTPVAEAPPASAPPLTLRVQRDTTVGIVRRVTLAVRSEMGAERLYFQGSGGARGTRVASVNGRALADPFNARWVDHWGVPDSVVVLDLEMPAGSDVDLTISEHHLRPAEILGPGTFQRPPGLEADVLRWSDRAIFTTRFQGGPAEALGPTEPADALVPNGPGDAPEPTGAATPPGG